mmetsp:Transcript_35241/g.108012  ORF Transcript_35241/g.108012 Transcript_35241/m.108012 type:complete len:203 (+) Transcript_35241:79-687(+)
MPWPPCMRHAATGTAGAGNTSLTPWRGPGRTRSHNLSQNARRHQRRGKPCRAQDVSRPLTQALSRSKQRHETPPPGRSGSQPAARADEEAAQGHRRRRLAAGRARRHAALPRLWAALIRATDHLPRVRPDVHRGRAERRGGSPRTPRACAARRAHARVRERVRGLPPARRQPHLRGRRGVGRAAAQACARGGHADGARFRRV